MAFLRLSGMKTRGSHLPVTGYPLITQPCGVGTTVASVLQMGKLRHRGVEYLPKVSHMAND